MIGNDIVDINYSRNTTNWNRIGYQEKTLTQEEQMFLQQSSNKEQTFWRIWTMKEAAYKAYVRDFGGRFFNPKALVCNIIDENSGTVRIKEKTYQTKSTCTPEFMFTEAKLKSFSNIKTEIIDSLTPGFQSEYIHNILLQTIAHCKGIIRSDLEVRKNNDGVPSVWDRSNLQTELVSMTHCGRFGALSFIDA